MTVYNIALIGTGGIVATHLKFLKEIKQFNIAGIYGKDYQRARTTGVKFGVKAFRELDEILRDDSISVVDIATASDLHAEYGIKAAMHHKNIIVEKPVDISVSKAREFVDICRQNNCLLGIVFQHRFDETTQLLKEFIDNGVFGKLISGRFVHSLRRSTNYYLNREGHAHDRCKGVLINNGIHYIDLSLFLFGEVLDVRGITARTRPEIKVEDYASVNMKFKNGFLLNLEFKTNVKKSVPSIFEINGEKGSVIFEGDKAQFISLDLPFRNVFISRNHRKLYVIKKFNMWNKFNRGNHRDVFINYLQALRKKEKVSVDGAEGLASLSVVDMVYNQNQTGM